MAESEKPGGGAAGTETKPTTPAGGAAGGSTGSPTDGTPPGPVPYERFKEVNDLANTLKGELAKIKDDQRVAKERELSDQQRWQELATQRDAELKSERQLRLRIETAAKKGLPIELAGRLTGNTAEEMAADADVLLALMKPKAGPGVPPGGSGLAPELRLDKMTPEEIRQNAGKLLRSRQ